MYILPASCSSLVEPQLRSAYLGISFKASAILKDMPRHDRAPVPDLALLFHR